MRVKFRRWTVIIMHNGEKCPITLKVYILGDTRKSSWWFDLLDCGQSNPAVLKNYLYISSRARRALLQLRCSVENQKGAIAVLSPGAPEHFDFWRGKTSKGAHLSEVVGEEAKRPSGGRVYGRGIFLNLEYKSRVCRALKHFLGN